MKPPRAPINTPTKAKRARAYLGLDKSAMARTLRLGDNGRATIARYESEGPIPGPSQLAYEYLVQQKEQTP